MNNIDFYRLRRDLIDYYGTATSLFPAAIMEVIDIKKASHEKLLVYARNCGFNLNNYVVMEEEISSLKYKKR